MDDSIKYISKVEIKNLWGRYDLVWNLEPGVNVLSGINGSGKSTVLNCVSSLLERGGIANDPKVENLGGLLSFCDIYIDDKLFVHFRNAKQGGVESGFGDFEFSSIRRERTTSILGNRYILEYFSLNNYFYSVLSDVDLKRLNETVIINRIATFDNLLHPSEAVQKLSDDNVKTELDWEIYQLQKLYLDYQINIGKRAFDIISKNGSNSQQAVANVRKSLDSFFQILDDLFAATGKRVNKDKNNIGFFSDTVELTPYQLSSGEKQLLVILLTVLVQDNKNAILFLDEPEISLHIDWQKKLIQYIRELNPNVQVILATHSPAIIMEGWLDKVQEVSDLITLDRKAPANAAK